MKLRVKGIVRYPHVVTASSPPDIDKLMYSVQLLIHKSDPQIKEINNALDETTKNGFPKGKPEGFITCFTDGINDKNTNEKIKDYMILKFSTLASMTKPGAYVGPKRSEVIDPSEEADMVGKIGYVAGGTDTYSVSINNGVKIYLNAIWVPGQKGDIPVEFLTSKPTADEIFGDLDGGVIASPVETSKVSLPPAPPATGKYEMTEKATGSRDAYIEAGWNDEKMISEGIMLPPNGVTPSFS